MVRPTSKGLCRKAEQEYIHKDDLNDVNNAYDSVYSGQRKRASFIVEDFFDIVTWWGRAT